MNRKIKPSMRRARGLDKARIAEAVHAAVCEATGSDGSYQCVRYAHAGRGLIDHLRVRAEVQAGHLEIMEGGEVVKTLRYVGMSHHHTSGHVWLHVGGTVVDLAARHYPSYAGRWLSRTVPYIWGERRDLARYTMVADATDEAAVMGPESMDLAAAAINAYEGRRMYRAVEIGRLPDGMMLAGLERLA